MPLKQELTTNTTASPILASYDYQDVADGTGIVEFMFCQEEDSTGTGQFLTSNNLYADPVFLRGSATAVSTTDETYNFDVTLNSPRDLKGDIFTNLGIGVYSQSSGTMTFKIYTSVYHYDGTTETQIGSTIESPTWTGTSSGNTYYSNALLKIANTNKIHFAKGDILRAKIRLKTTRTSGVHYVYFATNPAGNTEPSTTSISKISVPFIITL